MDFAKFVVYIIVRLVLVGVEIRRVVKPIALKIW